MLQVLKSGHPRACLLKQEKPLQREAQAPQLEKAAAYKGRPSTVISSGQPLSRVQLFANPWTAAHQASLSIINSQTHFHRVDDAIQPSYPLLSPSPPTFNLSQHQGLFQ